MIEMTWRLARCSMLLLWLAAPGFVRAQPKAEHDAIYAYTDDRGALMHAQRLQDIPLHLRSYARRVDEQGKPAAGTGKTDQLIEWLSGKLPSTDSSAPQEPVVYRYQGPNGLPVFTNVASSVPPDQRAKARVDLRDVPLNSELGNALNAKLEERFESLRASEACAQLRSEAELSWWQRAWRDQRVAVVCGAALLVLLLLTPWMHSRGWGGPWARVLWTAVPLLGFVALSASMLMKASGTLGSLAPRAARCEPKAFQSAHDLPQRFSLVSAMETEQQALAQIAREAR
jgi:hypothetical protein